MSQAIIVMHEGKPWYGRWTGSPVRINDWIYAQDRGAIEITGVYKVMVGGVCAELLTARLRWVGDVIGPATPEQSSAILSAAGFQPHGSQLSAAEGIVAQVLILPRLTRRAGSDTTARGERQPPRADSSRDQATPAF